MKHPGPVAKVLDPAVRREGQRRLAIYFHHAEGWSAMRIAQHYSVRLEYVEELIANGFKLSESKRDVF